MHLESSGIHMEVSCAKSRMSLCVIRRYYNTQPPLIFSYPLSTLPSLPPSLYLAPPLPPIPYSRPLPNPTPYAFLSISPPYPFSNPTQSLPPNHPYPLPMPSPPLPKYDMWSRIFGQSESMRSKQSILWIGNHWQNALPCENPIEHNSRDSMHVK